MTLLTGTLLAQGRRTVAAALRASGNSMTANWSSFHQVLNRARWSPLEVSRQLLLLMVETFSRVISRAILKFTPGGPPRGQRRAPFGQRRHR